MKCFSGKRALGFATLILFSLIAHTPQAEAHISFGDDFECSENYDKNCMLKFNSHRIARLYFSGTESELGQNCSLQTQKLGIQIARAQQLLGVNPGDIEYTRPYITQQRETGRPTEIQCLYEVRSKRKDLRFERKSLRSHIWTDAEEQAGVCMDDVREAEAIPGSIGAGRGIVGSLLQGEMCTSAYILPGLDKTVRQADGSIRIVKFGSREHDLMSRGLSDGTTSPDVFREPYTP